MCNKCIGSCQTIITIDEMNIEGSLLNERREAEYSQLIEEFKNKINDINCEGITGPHLPGVGNCYESAKYKIAFCGFETYGWESLSSFLESDTLKLITQTDESINNNDYLKWASNYHATFWGFVLKFLAKFYKIDLNSLIDNKYPEILHSFMWVNSNSIERYEVSSSDAPIENWRKVKEASKVFDDLNHVINSCQPKVVFILYKNVDKEYFQNVETLSEAYRSYNININNKSNYLQIKKDMYSYCYERNSGTHIFTLPHPRWMGLFSGVGIDQFVDELISDLENYRVWEKMPESNEDWRTTDKIEEDKASMEYKCKIIATLAHYLTAHNLVMSGKELQGIFNNNDILTTYRTPFGEKGERGIYTVIRNAWRYYQYTKHDYQTAYAIARSFVNKNGEYAYNT